MLAAGLAAYSIRHGVCIESTHAGGVDHARSIGNADASRHARANYHAITAAHFYLNLNAGSNLYSVANL